MVAHEAVVSRREGRLWSVPQSPQLYSGAAVAHRDGLLWGFQG